MQSWMKGWKIRNVRTGIPELVTNLSKSLRPSQVHWVVNELAGSGCTKPDKWAFLILPCAAELYFLFPICADQHSSQWWRPGSRGCPTLLCQQRPIWFDPLHGLWLSLPLACFVFAAKQTNFLPPAQIPGIPGARPQGHVGRQAASNPRPQRIMQTWVLGQYAPTRLWLHSDTF